MIKRKGRFREGSFEGVIQITKRIKNSEELTDKTTN